MIRLVLFLLLATCHGGLTKQIPTFEPKLETIKPKLETIEPKLETIEPKLETIEPKLETILPKVALRGGLDVQPVSIQSRGALVSCNNQSPVSLVGSSASSPVVIQTPNYPNNYLDNTYCVYSVQVPANTQVKFDITSVNLECPYDYIQFGFSGQYLPDHVCPTAPTSYSIGALSSAYTFNIAFSSDYSITYQGFKINIYLNGAAPQPTTTAPQPTTTAPPPPPGTCRCGQWTARLMEDSDRIVGGFIAPPNSLPYQVGIWGRTSSNPFCGGTLISPNYVLTAAHCTDGSVANSMRVALKDIDYTNMNDGQIFINVAQIIQHPGYNPTTTDKDYSLLRLESSAPISSSVNIACLPPDVSQLFVGTNFTISGWGTTSAGGTQSARLKAAFVTGITTESCQRPYANQSIAITSYMMCATVNPINTDTCQGDSGGPLAATINGKVTVVGVTSFGIGCAQDPYPGVYSRITAVKDWILSNSDAGSCQN